MAGWFDKLLGMLQRRHEEADVRTDGHSLQRRESHERNVTPIGGAHRVGRGARMFLSALVVGAVVGGCGLAGFEDRDPAAIPDGPLEAVGAEATGPVVELGRGQSLGTGWRYSIFEGADGWCTQLEMSSFASTGCGDTGPQDGHVFAGIGSGTSPDGATPFEGIVGPEVAEVWLTTASGQRIETRLMSLADAGLEGSAFVGFAPPDAGVNAAVALDAGGRELETYDLP